MWSSKLHNVKLAHQPYIVETIFTARQYVAHHPNLNSIIKPAFYKLVRGALTKNTINKDIQNESLLLDDLVMILSARNKFVERWVAIAALPTICENTQFEAFFS